MDVTGIASPVMVAAQHMSNAVKDVAPAPRDAAMEQFNAIMHADTVRPPSEAAVSPTATQSWPLAGTSSVSEQNTLGGQILSAMNSAAGHYADTLRDTKVRLESMTRHDSVVDMLRLQANMLQMSVQYELVGKVVSSATKNVDTLVRMS